MVVRTSIKITMRAISRDELYRFLCGNEQELGIEIHKNENSSYYEVVDANSLEILVRSNQHIPTQLKILGKRVGKDMEELIEDIITFLEID